jgi:sulfur-oxidizing protein SoxA
MNVALDHPKEKEAYAIGEKIFHFRGGTHDFACTSCHGADNQRIRLQDLPNLGKPADAQKAYVGWPGYRLTQGEVRSMQWRLYECFRQQRFPELEFVSPASIALTTYLARNANGGVLIAPSIKR